MNNTFLNMENDQRNLKYDATFYGLDFITTEYLEGVQDGAEKIRELSLRYANVDGTTFPLKVYNPERGYILGNVKINDFGNIRSESDMKNDKEKSKFPVFVGSDHGATYYILDTYFKDRQITVLQFDAHGDYLDEYDTYLHGSVMRKVRTLSNIDKVVHCGLRGNLNSGPGMKQSEKDGNVIIPNRELDFGAIEKHVSKEKPVYITIDVDFFDPSIAPATHNVEPGGFYYEEFRILITEILERYDVIGVDIVEYAPDLDYADITGNMIVNLIMEIIAAKYNRN